MLSDIVDVTFEKTIVVGDVHGDIATLKKLLQTMNFRENVDRLLVTGDMVNGAANSLEVLRWLRKNNALVNLGNHEMWLFYCCVMYDRTGEMHEESFRELIESPDRKEIIDWLRHQPFMRVYGKDVFVHAGIPHHLITGPSLKASLPALEALVNKAHEVIQGDDYANFVIEFHRSYKTEDTSMFRGEISSAKDVIALIKCFVHTRLCNESGLLLLGSHKDPKQAPASFYPWFHYTKDKVDPDMRIFFGHWSDLQGKTGIEDECPNIVALDAGCSKQQSLKGYCLETGTSLCVDVLKD